MVIEIPRWLDDAIDGQKWTLIGVAVLAVFWAATLAWYVAFAAQPPPREVAPRGTAGCLETPDARARLDAARELRCQQPAPGPARHPATVAR
jgi:hypothetical protein